MPAYFRRCLAVMSTLTTRATSPGGSAIQLPATLLLLLLAAQRARRPERPAVRRVTAALAAASPAAMARVMETWGELRLAGAATCWGRW